MNVICTKKLYEKHGFPNPCRCPHCQQVKERENMKFIEIIKILCKRYNISASDAAESAKQLKSDLMAFRTEEDIIKFLESLERKAFKGHERG